MSTPTTSPDPTTGPDGLPLSPGVTFRRDPWPTRRVPRRRRLETAIIRGPVDPQRPAPRGWSDLAIGLVSGVVVAVLAYLLLASTGWGAVSQSPACEIRGVDVMAALFRGDKIVYELRDEHGIRYEASADVGLRVGSHYALLYAHTVTRGARNLLSDVTLP